MVRLAASNLNANHIVLEQPELQRDEAMSSARKRLRSLVKVSSKRAATTASKIIAGASHSGESKGIMRSVHNNGVAHVTVDAMSRKFRYCPIHDPRSMVIFRLIDSQQLGTPDVKVLLTAGPNNDPNQLPENFLADRQFNKRSGNLTFFLNHAALAGFTAIPGLKPDGIARPALIPRQPYCLRIQPRVDKALVEYAELHADVQDLPPLIPPNETIIIDIRLTRVVREGVFRLTRHLNPRSFRYTDPGGPI